MTLKPSIEEFAEKARAGNLIPVYEEILADMETPVSAFLKIAGQSRHAFLLESVEQGENIGRFSFLGSDPELVFECRGKQVTITEQGERRRIEVERAPLNQLREVLRRYRPVPDPELPPFTGGVVGYVSYDMVRDFERLPSLKPDDIGAPDAHFILADTFVIFDHVKRKIILLTNAHVAAPRDAEIAYERAAAKIAVLRDKLNQPLVRPQRPDAAPAAVEPKSNFTREAYYDVVERCKEYIRAGDIVQVVPSQRWHMPLPCDPFDIYRALRTVNPSPYMFYLKADALHLAGSSPETLVKLIGETITVRPIAGTRRRGRTPEEDKALERELLADPKERAEHVMLVDLGRNDVGRVARYGTVRVTDLMVVERYSHVMHIVSNVEGQIRPGLDAFDVLRACFPAGTLTGAPKIRAMEIIEEMEPQRRGPYGGAMGYVGFNGNLDACITIRTVVVKGNDCYVQAGGGVVADSVPELEFKETENKARGLMRAIEMAARGLT
ncbi:MAG: anthranilate synthase component I [Candidatus Sumerlaeia bacterium]|nr:anthranilate synthase component I [Candidatus Sumerlaeia bacterium]